MEEANWGWGAGAGFISLAWIMYVFLFPKEGRKDFFMTRLWEGADGRASFSKFQFWLWTWIVVLGIFSVWIARIIVAQDIVKPIDDIPETVLGLLGLSVATSLVAKHTTTLYLNQNLTRKPAKKPRETTTPFQELLADDSGVPELAKLQMFLFTLVAVIFFLITVGDKINSGIEAELVLPDVDQSLLVLMGVSAGGYIGKKFVTRERPSLTAITPAEVFQGTPTTIMLTGRALGNEKIGVLVVGPRLYKTDEDKRGANVEWTDSIIYFDFDGNLPPNQNYKVEVVVGNAKSEPQILRVVQPPGDGN